MLLLHFVSGSNSSCFDSDISDFQFWVSGQRLNPDKPDMCDSPFYWKLPKDLAKPLVYTNWIKGQPDCFLGEQGCLEVTYATGYMWNDVRCSAEICALCQIL